MSYYILNWIQNHFSTKQNILQIFISKRIVYRNDYILSQITKSGMAHFKKIDKDDLKTFQTNKTVCFKTNKTFKQIKAVYLRL